MRKLHLGGLGRGRQKLCEEARRGLKSILLTLLADLQLDAHVVLEFLDVSALRTSDEVFDGFELIRDAGRPLLCC